MPAVDVAVAAIVTVLETVAPFAGDVIEVEIPAEVITRLTPSACGELEALGSAMVAVALYVPRANVAGFTMNATLVLAPPLSELDAGLNVSHDWVLVADQLSVVLAIPAFVITTGWEEVAVLPCTAVKLSELEVATERIGGDALVTLIV